MLKAFRDTLDDIQDIEVGRGKNKKIIPAKIVKAHMLMSVVTGMRSSDINDFVSQINPSEEQLKATDSVKTFLRSDDKVMVINNKGKLTEYALNPTLYSILSDATQSASGEKVFPSAASIEKSYLDILQNKLTQAGYPAIKQNVKGVLKDVPLSHNILRKFAFSFVERIPEAEGGGTSNADALIQHKTKDRSIGETTYRAGTLGEFQTTKETTAQSAFLKQLLPEGTTDVEFLKQQGFNELSFPDEIYSQDQLGTVKAERDIASRDADKEFRRSIIDRDDLSPESKEYILDNHTSKSWSSYEKTVIQAEKAALDDVDNSIDSLIKHKIDSNTKLTSSQEEVLKRGKNLLYAIHYIQWINLIQNKCKMS